MLTKTFYFIIIILSSTTTYAASNLTEELENKYFSTLDSWVKNGGNLNEVQNIIVKTCGKLIMHTASTAEKISLSTIKREDFHFRVDVCTKMTVNRVHPQPEFKNKETVKIICEDSKVIILEKLCRRSGLK